MKFIIIILTAFNLVACGIGDIIGDYNVTATMSKDTCAEPTRAGNTVQVGMTISKAGEFYYLFEGSNGFVLESEDGVDFADSYSDSYLGCEQIYTYTSSLVIEPVATGAASMNGDLKLHYENCVTMTCDIEWDLNGLRYIKSTD